MGEFENGLKFVFGMSGPQIARLPSGRWAFVGKVPAHLAFCRPDGSRPSMHEAQLACEVSAAAAGLIRRTFSTVVEAEAAWRNETPIVQPPMVHPSVRLLWEWRN